MGYFTRLPIPSFSGPQSHDVLEIQPNSKNDWGDVQCIVDTLLDTVGSLRRYGRARVGPTLAPNPYGDQSRHQLHPVTNEYYPSVTSTNWGRKITQEEEL